MLCRSAEASLEMEELWITRINDRESRPLRAPGSLHGFEKMCPHRSKELRADTVQLHIVADNTEP